MFDRVKKIVEDHTKWRRECLNLIASESVMSPLAEKFFISDFSGRYDEHSGPERHYKGTKYSYEIEELCNDIFRDKFNTSFVDVRPISGSTANLAVYGAFTKLGDVIVSPGIPNGAHISHTRVGLAGIRGLKNIDMSFDQENMNIDVEKTVDLIKKVDPKLIILGASMFLFPHPIKEIRESIDEDIKIMYDAAHVFGLVYNKKFQKPLEDGADVITSSTHKTFQGPQGGIIIGNRMDEKEWKKIENSLFPGILSNTHIHRFPSLAITALEMNEFGEGYSSQTIKNAKALAESLNKEGFKVLCPQLGFTESHQVIVDIKEFNGGRVVADRLEECNIICNKMSLPWDSQDDATKNPSGIRLGVQEMTRFGMKEKEMKMIAELFRKALIEKLNVEKVKREVIDFRNRFQEIKYCFKDQELI
jgi:glycine hydroxymethyltransferase